MSDWGAASSEKEHKKEKREMDMLYMSDYVPSENYLSQQQDQQLRRGSKRDSWHSDVDTKASSTAHKRRGVQTKDKRPFLVSFLQSDDSTLALTNLLKFCKAYEGSWNATLAHGNRVTFFKEHTQSLFDQESSQILSGFRKVSDRTLRKKFGEAEDFARTNYLNADPQSGTNIPEWGLLFCEFFMSQKHVYTRREDDEKKVDNDDGKVATNEEENHQVQVSDPEFHITTDDNLSSSVREFLRMFI